MCPKEISWHILSMPQKEPQYIKELYLLVWMSGKSMNSSIVVPMDDLEQNRQLRIIFSNMIIKSLSILSFAVQMISTNTAQEITFNLQIRNRFRNHMTS